MAMSWDTVVICECTESHHYYQCDPFTEPARSGIYLEDDQVLKKSKEDQATKMAGQGSCPQCAFGPVKELCIPLHRCNLNS